ATAERVVLSRVGGGCVAPMGVFARITGEEIRIRAEVLSVDAESEVKMDREYPVESYYEGAEEVAEEMIEEGATEIVKRAEEEAYEGEG
ncbi:MAG: porphobilinogen deaminase, partial [Halobacteria archaeon]|nr:porphobilinogen deaminase [Halobacteria archaeon]